MMLRVYMQLKLKRAETIALLDSGVTENFMNLEYSKYLHLLIKISKNQGCCSMWTEP